MRSKPTPSSPQPKSVERPGQKPWTVRSVLRWTADFFAQHDLSSARLDAEILLAHVLEQDRLALYLRYEEPVPETALATYRGLIRRRVNREPISYITGMREFYAISFAVDPSVLIPRHETEHLVEYVVQYAEAHHGPTEHGFLKIFEIGTGCGNLCIALAKHLPQAQIVSMDISSSAILIANQNLRGQPDCGERILFFQGDLLEGLHPERAKFHLIVSNPPYVPAESWNDLPPEIRDYEPRIALDGGRRGTEILDRILRDAAKYLLPGGTLVLEIGADQAEVLLGKAKDTGHYRQSGILEDYAGKPRVLVATT
jgi:release factor glutamine methyltransferase